MIPSWLYDRHILSNKLLSEIEIHHHDILNQMLTAAKSNMKNILGEMLFRTLTTTPIQIFCKIILTFQVSVKIIKE